MLSWRKYIIHPPLHLHVDHVFMSVMVSLLWRLCHHLLSTPFQPLTHELIFPDSLPSVSLTLPVRGWGERKEKSKKLSIFGFCQDVQRFLQDFHHWGYSLFNVNTFSSARITCASMEPISDLIKFDLSFNPFRSSFRNSCFIVSTLFIINKAKRPH